MFTFRKLIVVVFILTLCSCKRTQREIANKNIKTSVEAISNGRKLNPFSQTNLNFSRPYNRTSVDKGFIKIKKILTIEGVNRGKAENLTCSVFIDGYTGKRLLGGTSYEFDHVRSAESIHSKYKSILTDEQISIVANCRENITPTCTKINRAKGKRALEILLMDPEKIKKLRIDPIKAKEILENADKAIEQKVQEIIATKN